jgi:hypothetical protein
MERSGVPIDTPMLESLREHGDDIKNELVVALRLGKEL